MIILFGSHKGGVGKTTTLVNMAVMLMRRKLKVSIIKADKNDELSEWYGRRKEAGLPVMPLIEAFGNITKEVKRIANISDVVLIESAGHDSAEFRSGLAVADVLITLIRPSSQLEIDTLPKLTTVVRKAQQIENPSLRPYVLLTRCKSSPTNLDATTLANALKSDPDWLQPLSQRITQLDVFENAVNEGKGVHEVKKASSLSKAKAQLELVAAELGL
ncbi:cobQ/CobB/MinD/ParA nucleotide binding domain protein (plasmid) [Yersinia frederiksenii Y225]|nr:cobQ/CobB/MinD/ParA nucleotide binding domain protein [Yersinia frederiksenii Y225]